MVILEMLVNVVLWELMERRHEYTTLQARSHVHNNRLTNSMSNRLLLQGDSGRPGRPGPPGPIGEAGPKVYADECHLCRCLKTSAMSSLSEIGAVVFYS